MVDVTASWSEKLMNLTSDERSRLDRDVIVGDSLSSVGSMAVTSVSFLAKGSSSRVRFPAGSDVRGLWMSFSLKKGSSYQLVCNRA